MNDDPKLAGKEFAEFLRKVPSKNIDATNKRALEEAIADHAKFVEAFRQSRCAMCGGGLGDFNADQPCLHWLLRPAGFTKWHFPQLAEKYRYRRIEAYLRWVANVEAVAQNINDLKDEGTGKLIELTIRYQDFEWAFSCATADYNGHETDSADSRKPHYHFQMRVKKQAFIRYNDFHVPFHKMDIMEMEAMKHAPDLIKGAFPGGEGMSDVLNEQTLEAVVQGGIAWTDGDTAPIKLDTFVMAEEGKTISGDDLAAIIEEAKSKGVTIASLIHKLPNAKVQTIVTPGDGVVEQAPRSGRGRSK